MRISDWSSDVCSSDLEREYWKDRREAEREWRKDAREYRRWARGEYIPRHYLADRYYMQDYRSHDLSMPPDGYMWVDRKSVVSGKSVSVRVELGGRGLIKNTNINQYQ